MRMERFMSCKRVQNARLDILKKHRISTTISTKHWELLKKHAAKLETQQIVLELALESLENNSKHNPVQSPEEELWMRIGREVKTACLVQKEGLKELIETADIERVREYATHQKPIEYTIEYFYQKPLKECSLKEVIDGIVVNLKISNWLDTINYTDDGDHYTLKITHSLGLNNSKIFKIVNESVFKTYGVKAESNISEKSVFMKIFKNL